MSNLKFVRVRRKNFFFHSQVAKKTIFSISEVYVLLKTHNQTLLEVKKFFFFIIKKLWNYNTKFLEQSVNKMKFLLFNLFTLPFFSRALFHIFAQVQPIPIPGDVIPTILVIVFLQAKKSLPHILFISLLFRHQSVVIPYF